MANLTDAIQWVDEIYKLATTDLVLGGDLPAGISNRQAQELANRTAWLKDQLEDAQEALSNIHPIGEVQMIAGAAYNAADYDLADPQSTTYGAGLPGTPAEHWALCFGGLGTVDLRGKFVAGMDPANFRYTEPGVTGGASEARLSIANLPAHSHKLGLLTDNRGTTQNGSAIAKSDSGYTGQDRNRSTENTGGGQPFDILPPYYTLVYRQRISN